MRKTFLKKGACAIAAAALAGAMVPAAALATDQTSTGGSTEVTSSSVEVVYEKDCEWTATYPASVSLAKNADGSASATADAVSGAAVDSYRGTTTFKIKCVGTERKVSVNFNNMSPEFLSGCTITGLDEDNTITVPDGATVSIATSGSPASLTITFTKDSAIKTFSISANRHDCGFPYSGVDDGSTVTEDKTITISFAS